MAGLDHDKATAKSIEKTAAYNKADKALKVEKESHTGPNLPDIKPENGPDMGKADVKAKGSQDSKTIAKRLEDQTKEAAKLNNAPGKVTGASFKDKKLDIRNDDYEKDSNDLFALLDKIGIPTVSADIKAAAKSAGLGDKKAEALEKRANRTYGPKKLVRAKLEDDGSGVIGEEITPSSLGLSDAEAATAIRRGLRKGYFTRVPYTEEELKARQNLRDKNWAANRAKGVLKDFAAMGYDTEAIKNWENPELAVPDEEMFKIPKGDSYTIKWDLSPEYIKKGMFKYVLSNNKGQGQNIFIPISQHNDFIDALEDFTGGNYSRGIIAKGDSAVLPKSAALALAEFKRGKKADYNNVPFMVRANTAEYNANKVPHMDMLDMGSLYYSDPEKYAQQWQEDQEARQMMGMEQGFDKAQKHFDEEISDYTQNKHDIEEAIAGLTNKLGSLEGIDQAMAKQKIATLEGALAKHKWVVDPLSLIDSPDNRVVIKSSKQEGLADYLGEPVKKPVRKIPAYVKDDAKLHKARDLEAMASRMALNNSKPDPYLSEPIADAGKTISENTIKGNIPQMYRSMLQMARKNTGMSNDEIRTQLPLNTFIKRYVKPKDGKMQWDWNEVKKLFGDK